jgi:chromate transporter
MSAPAPSRPAGGGAAAAPRPSRAPNRAGLGTVAREWTRIGVTGFGGPPAHIALLRGLVVEREHWMDATSFEDANAACGLLPGPASTQLAIFCAYRVAGPVGAVVGGLGFIVPAVVMILALSVLFLASNPPTWVRGAGTGAGAAVPAVALGAGLALLGPSWRRTARAGPAERRGRRARTGAARAFARRHSLGDRRLRWIVYSAAGVAGALALGAYLVLVLLVCGAIEVGVRGGFRRRPSAHASLFVALPRPFSHMAVLGASTGGYGALAWTAFKVGALTFGGGFVIVPLMQGDAVHVYHWMSNAQFLNAVALGQITPGPVVATVAAVGYAAHGLSGGLVAAAVAFMPSFAFVLLAGRRFERLRENTRARAFLDGAGPAAIGAILGAAVTLAAALSEVWQIPLLVLAVLALLVARRGVVRVLLAAGVVGAIAGLAGAPLP